MLYLLRHAEAVDLEDDAARPLTLRGRESVVRLAGFLKGRIDLDEIWHSPLVRARETAELLAEGLAFGGTVKEARGLRPCDDPSDIASRLESPRSVALVGHEPHLGSLGSLLVAGWTDPAVFVMRKCSLLALERIRPGASACWAVRWHIAPELLAR